MNMHKGVAVFVEQRSGEIQSVSLELLGKGKELANKLGEKLTAILLGNNIDHLANELIYSGADEVVVVNDPALDVFVTEPYTKALVHVINERKPEIVLIGATTIGRDLGPRVSARVHTGLTADCTSLEIDDETRNLLMTRPAFGGNIMATIICPDHKPQMSTVRPGVMKKLERNEELTGEIINISVEFTSEDMNVQVLEYIKETTKKVNLEDASIIVAAGRGVGEENIELLKELADLLGGQIAGSRAAIDAGWLEKDRQIG
ncbi:MAG: electron transfer flavoprotein subunit alpha/FixB family protein, partial [Romboutsia sp.]|nr:electron transfer flavoprotein subunit alpha/FixB family protein [Romboutsia sp.]